jgi:hypothetical protein
MTATTKTKRKSRPAPQGTVWVLFVGYGEGRIDDWSVHTMSADYADIPAGTDLPYQSSEDAYRRGLVDAPRNGDVRLVDTSRAAVMRAAARKDAYFAAVHKDA